MKLAPLAHTSSSNAGSSLASLPHPVLVEILASCDGASLDAALLVASTLTGPVNEARRKIVQKLAARPGRSTPEVMPTRLELHAMGFATPNMTGVLHAMQDHEQTRARVCGDARANAAMEALQQAFAQLGMGGARTTALLNAVHAAGALHGDTGLLTRNTRAHADMQVVARRYGGLRKRHYSTFSDTGECDVNQQTHGFGTRTARASNGLPRYEGQFHHGRAHGLGYEILADGERYEGMFKSGLRHGEGVLLCADGSRYEGRYEAGKRHGMGRLYVAGGILRYEGMHANDAWHGEGTHHFPNGFRYVGAFENGMKHGYGRASYACGSLLFEAVLRQNALHGKVTFYNPDGSRNFEGVYQNNLKHGFGIDFYRNGSRYEGTFVDGKKHGQGTLFHPEGGYFSGLYCISRRHGPGVEVGAHGTRHPVQYRAGMRLVPEEPG